MTDVVQQCRQTHGGALLLGNALQLAPFLERRERPAGEVIRPERMLEAGVRGTGIDEEGVAELANVAELYGGGIEREERNPVEPDVVPERIADDFELG